MYILSVSIRTSGIKEKNDWLDKYAPFFKNENRVIISKEENSNISYSELKINYLKNVSRDNCKLILIDDDPNILKAVYNRVVRKLELNGIKIIKST